MVSESVKRGFRRLPQDCELQVGIDVREAGGGAVAMPFVQPRMKVLEHVELRLQRVRVAELHVVLAAPPKGPAGGGFEAGGVDRKACRPPAVMGREVLADDGDDPHRGEKAGRWREVRRRSAERPGRLSEG